MMYHNDFDTKWNSNRRKFKIAFYALGGFVLLFFIISLIAKGTVVANSKKGSHLYLITVDDRKNSATHVSDSIILETERCIEFRNEFGFIQKECGDRVSITTFK